MLCGSLLCLGACWRKDSTSPMTLPLGICRPTASRSPPSTGMRQPLAGGAIITSRTAQPGLDGTSRLPFVRHRLCHGLRGPRAGRSTGGVQASSGAHAARALHGAGAGHRRPLRRDFLRPGGRAPRGPGGVAAGPRAPRSCCAPPVPIDPSALHRKGLALVTWLESSNQCALPGHRHMQGSRACHLSRLLTSSTAPPSRIAGICCAVRHWGRERTPTCACWPGPGAAAGCPSCIPSL